MNPTALRGNVWLELVHYSKERVVLSGKSVIVVGARCADVRANELLVVRGCCVPYVSSRCCIARHMCLHLVVMERVDQPMSIALGCCTIIDWLAATISVRVAWVVGFCSSWR